MNALLYPAGTNEYIAEINLWHHNIMKTTIFTHIARNVSDPTNYVY